jgi:hypothetical protein
MDRPDGDPVGVEKYQMQTDEAELLHGEWADGS